MSDDATVAPPERAPKRGRRWRRVAIVLTFVVLAFVALGLGLFPQEPLRRFAERRLREALGPNSRMGYLHVVPARLTVVVGDLEIDAPGYHLVLPRARVKADTDLLLKRTLSLDVVEADSPRITLRPSPTPQEKSELPTIRIDRVDVTGGQLVYEDRPQRVVVDGIEAHGSIGTGALDVSSTGGSVSAPRPLALGPVRGRVRVSSDMELDVESLEARVAGSRLAAQGTVGKLDDPDLDLRFQADVDPADVVPQHAAAFDGRVAVEGSASGRPEDLDVTARFDAAAVGGAVDGSVTLDGRRVEAGLQVRGADLARIARTFGGASPAVRGSVSARARAEGDLDRELRFETDVQAQAVAGGLRHRVQSSLQGSVEPASASVDARWRARVDSSAVAEASNVRSLSLEAQGTARGPVPPAVDGRLAGVVALRTPSGPESVRWTGDVRTRGRTVRARLDGEGRTGVFHGSVALAGQVVEALEVEARGELATLVPGAQGTLLASVTAAGPLSALSGEARVQGDAVAWNGVAVGPVLLRAHSVAGRGQATFEMPDWRVSGAATIAPGRVRGEVRLDDSPLAGLSPLLPRPIEGRLAGEVRFDAPLSAPMRSTLTADVAALEVRSGELSARAAQPFSVHLERQRLRLQDVAIEGPGVRLELGGGASLARGTVDLAATARVDLSRAPLPAPWTAAGTLEAEAQVQGEPSRPQIRGVARVADLVLSSAQAETPLLTGRAEVRLDGERLVLTPAELGFAGGNLRVAGALPLSALMSPAAGRPPRGRSDADIRVEWAQVSVPALAGTLGSGAPAGLAGVLAGHVALQGPLSAPEAARGEISLRAEGLRLDELAVELSPVTGTLQGGVLEVSPFDLGSGDVRLRSSARVDLRQRSLVASSRGRIDLRTLSPLLTGAALGGQADVDVSASGPFDAVAGSGRITLEGVSMRMRDIPQAVTDGQGSIVLEGRRLVVPGITARLGGGTLALSGSAGVAGPGGAGDILLKVTGRDLALVYPAEFKSRLHGDLTLTGSTQAMVLGGEVRIERGLYDTDINVEDVLRVPPPAKQEKVPALLASIGLDLGVATENQILVRNNLAELGVTGRLNLRGDLATPAPFGRLEVAEGGKVFLQTREFTVEQGGLIFNGTLEPEVSLRAKTVITQPGDSDVEVTIVADGPVMNPDLELSSQPEYSEKEIASLVATGRRSVDLDSTAWVAGEHAAALFATRASRRLARGLKPLGFDEVSIQPQLLAREADPSARFTFAKHLNPRLRLIYSIGLNDAEERYFEGQYRLQFGRELTARLARDEDGLLTYGLGQRWEFGAPSNARSAWKPTPIRLENVLVQGDSQIAAGRLRRQAGDKVTPWDLLGDAERLERRLRREGHLEALVSSRLEGETATFTVDAGPRYVWDVRGLAAPPDLGREVLSAIHEEEAFQRGRERVLAAARERGFLWARVETSVDIDDRGRVLVFEVDPGPSVEQAQVRFPGASALGEGELLRAAGGPGALLTSAADARERILDLYRERYYLTAEVDPPRVHPSADRTTVSVEVPVREGPRARLATLRFEGEGRPEEELRAIAALPTGVPVDTDAVSEAGGRVRDDYLKRGYSRMRLRPELVPSGSDLDAVFHVNEGEPTTVGAIVVSGLHRTRESLVRRQVDLRPGDPLDPRRMAAIEKRLLDLGVFARAVVTATEEDPATVQVEVEEEGPFSVAYDVRFSSEERATTLLDAEAGNIAGIGLAIGGRYRVGRDLRETRGSVHLPSLGLGGDTTASIFRVEDDRVVREGGTPEDLPFTEVQQGFQIQQTVHKGGRWNILSGYTYKDIQAAATGLRHDIAGLSASVLRETRDNPLDARGGSFLSLTLEGGASWLASDFDYFRVFAQFYTAKPVGDALTWAQGYRLGLARGLEAQRDEQVSLTGRSTELFHAGGPTSLRGFARDSVGPRGPLRNVSTGGEALIVLNQELRYMHSSGIGAAVFYDAGNVFERVSDFSLALRHSVGAGVRYDSPVGLLRLDVGFPLNKRPGDSAFQWFFSLGQAF